MFLSQIKNVNPKFLSEPTKIHKFFEKNLEKIFTIEAIALVAGASFILLALVFAGVGAMGAVKNATYLGLGIHKAFTISYSLLATGLGLYAICGLAEGTAAARHYFEASRLPKK